MFTYPGLGDGQQRYPVSPAVGGEEPPDLYRIAGSTPLPPRAPGAGNLRGTSGIYPDGYLL